MRLVAHLLLGFVLIAGGVAPAGAADAGSCAARDWRCLLKQARDDVFTTPREELSDGSMRAKLLTRIARAYPENERAEVMSAVLADAREDEMRRTLAIDKVKMELMRKPDARALDQALASKSAPVPDVDYRLYVWEAFYALVAADDQDALFDLWQKHHVELQRALKWPVREWIGTLARKHPDRLAAYMKQWVLPDEGWAAVAAAASAACRAGEQEKGERLLTLLDGERRQWRADRPRRAVDVAATLPAVFDCEKDDRIEEARVRFEDVLELMRLDQEAIRDMKGPDPAWDAWAIDNVRYGVSVKNRLFVHHLLDAGLEEEAKGFFAKLPPESISAEVREKGEKFVTTTQAFQNEWRGEKEFWRQVQIHNPAPATLLKSLEIWEEQSNPDEVAWGEQRFDLYASLLAEHGGDRHAVVRRLLALNEKARKVSRSYSLHEVAEIILAQAEFTLAGCTPDDARLLAWQKAIAGQKYMKDRTVGRVRLVQFIRFLDENKGRAPLAGSYGSCQVTTAAGK